MKKKITFAVLILSSLWICASVQISGRFNLFSSLYVNDQLTQAFMRHELGEFALKRIETQLRLSSQINEKLSWFLRLDLSASGGNLSSQGLFNESTPLASPSGTERIDFSLYEAHVRISDFLINKLDLTAGKQRISWGTADKIGVLDNLNPLDMAQFFTFSPEHFFERRPQTALNFEYYFKNREKLQLVLLLQKQVAPLPYGFNTLIGYLHPELETIVVGNSWDTDSLSEINLGFRFSMPLFNMDWGLSVYRGNLQVAYPSVLSPFTREAKFIYPGVSVLGLDLAGELAGVGFWAEFGLFLPDQIQAELRLLHPTNDGVVPVTLSGDLYRANYAKFVLGADYHFGHGWYVNTQYLHGFFDEVAYSDFAREYFKTKKGFFFGAISDYLFFRVEKALFDDKLLVKCSNIVDMMKGGAWTLFPEIELKLHDGFSLQSGLFMPLSGDPERSRFAFFRDNKLLYLMFRVDF